VKMDVLGGMQIDTSNWVASKKTVARATKFPWEFFTLTPVWAVISQHMVFNTTRYFFADWTAIYYKEAYNMSPVECGVMLTMPFITGAVVQILISGVEKPLIKSGYSPLQVRTLAGGCGFTVTAVCLLLMTAATNPWAFCFLLSVLEGSLACHACGYKANYMDLTSRYQGQFMGTGNTIASMCTFGMPLAVAALLGNNPHLEGGDVGVIGEVGAATEASRSWHLIFILLAVTNVVGVFINKTFTVVKELHVNEM
jgi:hypothetical protein